MRLHLINLVLLASVLTGAAVFFSACSGPGASRAQLQPASDVGSRQNGLPAPQLLADARSRRSSDALLAMPGKDYEALINHKVAADTVDPEALVFAPDAVAGQKELEYTAYAAYQFSLTPVKEYLKLKLSWLETPADGSVWLAFSNWNRGRWEWYNATNSGELDLTAPGMQPYAKAAGDPNEGLMYVVVLLTGDQSCRLKSLQVTNDVVGWTHSWGLTGGDQEYLDTCGDSAGNSYFTGSADVPHAPSHSHGMPFVKYSSTGEMQVNQVWFMDNGCTAVAIAHDSGDNIYICGINNVDGGTPDKILLLKLDGSGAGVWSETWAETGKVTACAMTLDNSGNIYVLGESASYGILVLKFDPNGTLLWQKGWKPAEGSASPKDIAVTAAGDIMVCGELVSPTFEYDALLIKFDASGAMTWSRAWDGGGSESVYSLAVDPAGNSYMAGHADSPGPNSLLYLSFSADGVLGVHQGWNGNGIEDVTQIAYTPYAVYITGSHAGTGYAMCHVMLIEYGFLGQRYSSRIFGSSAMGVFYGHGIALDNAGRLLCAGSYVANSTNGWEGNVWNMALINNDSEIAPVSTVENIGTVTDAAGAMAAATGTLIEDYGLQDTKTDDTDAIAIVIEP
jgi:hypothetical protein